ncbi:MAG: CBS domain-containing protein [Nitrosopumilaceae archaeon]|jgi:CBS domain-containing protein/uncharacterized C2H2 Zn-finger protein
MLIVNLEQSITDFVDSNLHSIPIQKTISEAGQKMTELGIDCLLVSENDDITGIVTQRDIMSVFSKKMDVSKTVESILSKPLITISNNAKVSEALQAMKEKNIRRLIVKKDNKPIGIITQKKIFGNLSSKAFEIPELELPEKIKCPYCPSLFERKEALSKHIDQIHTGYGVFQGNFSKVRDLGSVSSVEHYPKTIRE